MPNKQTEFIVPSVIPSHSDSGEAKHVLIMNLPPPCGTVGTQTLQKVSSTLVSSVHTIFPKGLSKCFLFGFVRWTFLFFWVSRASGFGTVDLISLLTSLFLTVEMNL